jgi:hypothetical protein
MTNKQFDDQLYHTRLGHSKKINAGRQSGLFEKLQQRHSTAGLKPCITYVPHVHKQKSINENEVKEFVAGFPHCVNY